MGDFWVFKFSKPAVVIILCLSLTACFGRLQPMYSVNESPIPLANSQLTYNTIEKAIFAAGANRNWIMQKRDGHTIRATQKSRSHIAVVDIKYTRTNFSINYASSQNLLYNGANIHRTYNHWIRNLESDIRKNLTLLAK